MTGLENHYPDELQEAERIDWEALADEIGTSLGVFTLPTHTEETDEKQIDKLALSRKVARYVRNGGFIDVDRVVIE